jgi:predicted RNase H-like HicB family nuclease
MSAKLKSSRKVRRPDRPFAADILSRARDIVSRYRTIFWEEDGEFYGRGLEVPTAMSDGKTPQDCIANTREALVTAVAVMLEDGQTPPAPASEEVRNQQINVRLTVEEKIALETAAQRQGFRGISDFIRSAALSAAKS